MFLEYDSRYIRSEERAVIVVTAGEPARNSIEIQNPHPNVAKGATLGWATRRRD
jgi:hypothetical protein